MARSCMPFSRTTGGPGAEKNRNKRNGHVKKISQTEKKWTLTNKDLKPKDSVNNDSNNNNFNSSELARVGLAAAGDGRGRASSRYVENKNITTKHSYIERYKTNYCKNRKKIYKRKYKKKNKIVPTKKRPSELAKRRGACLRKIEHKKY